MSSLLFQLSPAIYNIQSLPTYHLQNSNSDLDFQLHLRFLNRTNLVNPKLTNDQSEIINQSQLEQHKQNLLKKRNNNKTRLEKSLEEVCFLAKIEKNDTNIPMAQINSSPIRVDSMMLLLMACCCCWWWWWSRSYAGTFPGYRQKWKQCPAMFGFVRYRFGSSGSVDCRARSAGEMVRQLICQAVGQSGSQAVTWTVSHSVSQSVYQSLRYGTVQSALHTDLFIFLRLFTLSPRALINGSSKILFWP